MGIDWVGLKLAVMTRKTDGCALKAKYGRNGRIFFETTLEVDFNEDEDVWMFAFSHLESSMSKVTRLSIFLLLPTILLHFFHLKLSNILTPPEHQSSISIQREIDVLHGNINSV